MKNYAALLCLSLALAAACAPTSPANCTAGYEDLTDWHLTVPDPGSSIELDPECPSRATIALSTPAAAYVERIMTVTPGKTVSVLADLTTACDPGDGRVALGINEGGGGVAKQSGQLASQKLRASWTATTDTLGLVLGAQAKHPCEVGVRLIVTR